MSGEGLVSDASGLVPEDTGGQEAVTVATAASTAPPAAAAGTGSDGAPSEDTFPRQHARTRRLTLGEPRTITVSPDGRRVVFIRSRGGSDPIGCLWVLDVAVADDEPAGGERLVADPLVLLAGGDDDLPAAERARRERAREQAGGVVSYAANATVTVAAFALSGRLFVAGLLSGVARELPVEGPVFDPRPDPLARRLAYVRGRTLRLAELDGTSRELAGEEDSEISWGSAEFVAAEEMGRTRGYWWAPDGSAVVAARVDTTPVARWWISDPSQPDQPPVEHAYPAAGTANAHVSLWVLGLDGRRQEIWWDHGALPYLVDVQWPEPERIVLTVQSRDQRHVEVLAADPATGQTAVLFEDSDDVWVELAHGAPAVLDDGRIVMTADHEGARRLVTSSMPLTPPELQVRGIEAVIGHTLLFTANPVDDATSIGLWRFSDGATTEPLVTTPGVHSGWGGGKTVVVRSSTLDDERSVVRVLGGPELINHAEAALVRPSVTLLRAGERAIATGGPPPERRGRCTGAGGTVAGPARPLRRAPRPAGGARPQRLHHLAVVRRPGLRGGGRRRARHPRSRQRVGAGGPPRPRRPGPRGPGRSAPGGGRAAPPRPGPCGDPGLELRRLPRCAGRAPPSRRLPCRHRRRARHGLAPLRHALHGALPRHTGRAGGRVRTHLARGRGGSGRRPPTGPLLHRSTAWPTTTSWWRTASSCRRRSWPPAAHTGCCRCRASPT